MAILQKRAHREKRRKRVRRKLAGTAERPRLSVYRSNVNIYGQLIDDDGARTLAAADGRADAELVGGDLVHGRPRLGGSRAPGAGRG